MRFIRLPVLASLLLGAPVLAQTPIEIATIERDTEVSFGKEILPILRRNCLACHSNSDAYGELILETPSGLIKGGDSGPAVVAGKGAESLLIKVASHNLQPLMPPPDNEVAAKPLTPEELGLIQLWIDQGAKGAATDGLVSPEKWRALPPGDNPIYAVAVSPDGQFAACGRANQIFIYHVPTGQLITRLTDPELQQQSEGKLPGIAHLDVIQSLRFNHEGDRLASGGFRNVKIWRYPKDVQTQAVTTAGAIAALTVAPKRQQAIVAVDDNTIQLWNLANGELASTMTGHTGRVTALRVSEDEKLLFSSGMDNTIRVWDIGLGVLSYTIHTPTPVTALAMVRQVPTEAQKEAAGDGPAPEIREFLVSGGDDNVLRSWRLPVSFQRTIAAAPEGSSTIAMDSVSGLVAIATTGGEIQLREGLDGEPLRNWQAHEGPLTALRFITAAPEEGQPADERRVWLATAGSEQSIRIWDTSTGEQVHQLDQALSNINYLEGNATGTRLVSANELGQVVSWNLEPRAAVEPTEHGHQPVGAFATSVDRSMLAVEVVQSERPAVAIIDAATGRTRNLLMGHDGDIQSIVFSPDNSKVATASVDGTARVWLLSDAKFPEVARMLGHEGAVHAVNFNTDGTQLVTGGADKLVKTWSVVDGAELVSFAGHGAAVMGAGFASNNQPVSVAADKTLKQWNPANGQVVRSVPLAALPVSATFTADRTLVSVALDDNSLAVHQLSDGALLHSLNGHTKPVVTHVFSTDKTSLLSVAGDQRALLWRIADGQLLESFPHAEVMAAAYPMEPGNIQLLTATKVLSEPIRFQAIVPRYEQDVRGLAVNPAGSQVYVGFADGVIRGYTLETGAQAYSGNHGGPIRALAMRPDGQMLATAGEDKLVKTWNAANGAALAPNQVEGFGFAVDRLEFSRDGQVLAAREEGDTGRVVLASSTDGTWEEVLLGFHSPTTTLTAVGHENDRQLAFVVDGKITIVPLLSDRRITGHTQPITSIEALDELFFVSGSMDGTLRHWNLAAANPVVRQMNHGAPIVAVAIRGDGERFATGSDNGTIRLWNGTNGAQVAEMKGDIRAQQLVVKLNDEMKSSTTKLETAKGALDAAQKLLPMRTEAEATAKKALTDATADTTAKVEALTAATATKSAAEKLAIEAAAAAQKAAAAKEMADQLALMTAATAKIAADTAARLATASAAQPANQELASRATTAEAASKDAATKAQAAEAAKAAPTKTAADAAKMAEDTAAKALETGKPYTDAVTALAASQATQRTANSAHVQAAKDLEVATAAVPAVQKEIAELEALVTKLTTDLEAATTASTEAEQPIRSLAFSPDGSQLASGGDMGVVHTWDGTDGKSIASYVGHAAAVQSIAFLNDNAILSGSMDKSAIEWDLKPSWQLERVIGSPTDPETLIDRVVSVSFSRDGSLLATGGGVPSRNGELKVFKVEDGSPVLALPDAHTDAVNSVEISPDGRLVASASSDKYVRVFDIATGEQRAQCEGHTNHVLGVSWRGDGRLLASSAADNSIRTWNPQNGERVRTIGGYNKQVTSIRFIGQTTTTLACSGDQLVRMNNTDNGGAIRNFGGAVDYLYAVDGSPNGQVVVAGGHSGILRIWNGTNAQSLHVIESPQPMADEPAEGAEE